MTTTPSKPMTIGALARAAGVPVDTVRYYLKRALLPDPQRARGAVRRFDEDDLTRLRFVLAAKSLGFTLREIKDLLSLTLDDDAEGCDALCARAGAKAKEIDRRIAALRAARNSLQRIITTCESRASRAGCSIADELCAGARAAPRAPKQSDNGRTGRTGAPPKRSKGGAP